MEQSSTRTTSTTTNDRKMQLLATDGEARTTTARGTLQGATTVESAAPTTRACSRHAKRGTKLPSALSHTHEQSQQTEQCWLLRSTTTPQIRIRIAGNHRHTRPRTHSLALSHKQTNQHARECKALHQSNSRNERPVDSHTNEHQQKVLITLQGGGRGARSHTNTTRASESVCVREREVKDTQQQQAPTRQQRGRKQQQQQARKGRPRRCGIVRKTTRALEISLIPFSRCELCLDLDLAQCKNRSSSSSILSRSYTAMHASASWSSFSPTECSE